MIGDKKRIIKDIIVYLMFFTVLIAFITGFFLKDRDLIGQMRKIHKNGSTLKIVKGKNLIKIGKFCENETGNLNGYVTLTKGMGWGGPFVFAVLTNSVGIIDEIVVVDHKETHSYFRKLKRMDFFKQFSGKKISDLFNENDGIDMVSGATVSSLAFTDAIKKSCHKLGTEVLNLKIKDKTEHFKIGYKEIFLLILYVSVFIVISKRGKILRYIVMIAGFVFLGIFLNTSISIAGFSSIMLGYFPSITKNLFWWILVPGLFLITLITGKNIYCHRICPFGATQELISKISGIKIKINKKVNGFFGGLRFFLTWLSLIIIFLTQNPTMGAYEPFATLFGFEGIGIQWFILSIVLFGAFIIPLFWCRFFCPVKVTLQITTRFNSYIKNIARRSKR